MKNMKKLLAGITLGAVLVGSAAFSGQIAEAARHHRGEGGPGRDCPKYAEMTAEQKSAWESRHNQRVEWRKQDLQADVAAGRMTQAEADAHLTIMQERFQAIKDGKADLRGPGRHMRYADMTDAQKAEFKSRHEQRVKWHKQDLQAKVEAGKMTQAQADEHIARMEKNFQDRMDGKFEPGQGRRDGRGDGPRDGRGPGMHHRDGRGPGHMAPADCPRL